MRRTPLALLLLLGGCATAPTLDPGPRLPPSITATSAGYDIRLSDDAGPTEHALAAPPDSVWNAVMLAYQLLQVPVTTIDTRNRMIGNARLDVRRRLAGSTPSRWLQCGTGLTGDLADQGQVTLSILSLVAPGPNGGSRLQTKVNATAKAMGTSNNPVDCGSTGRLEERIRQLVEAQVGRRGAP